MGFSVNMGTYVKVKRKVKKDRVYKENHNIGMHNIYLVMCFIQLKAIQYMQSVMKLI